MNGVFSDEIGWRMYLVYRVGGDGEEGVVFARRDDAERVAHIRRALETSRTWGTFRAGLPEGEWETNLAPCFDDLPPDGRRFSADDVPGYSDGDYPLWLKHTSWSGSRRN